MLHALSPNNQGDKRPACNEQNLMLHALSPNNQGDKRPACNEQNLMLHALQKKTSRKQQQSGWHVYREGRQQRIVVFSKQMGLVGAS